MEWIQLPSLIIKVEQERVENERFKRYWVDRDTDGIKNPRLISRDQILAAQLNLHSFSLPPPLPLLITSFISFQIIILISCGLKIIHIGILISYFKVNRFQNYDWFMICPCFDLDVDLNPLSYVMMERFNALFLSSWERAWTDVSLCGQYWSWASFSVALLEFFLCDRAVSTAEGSYAFSPSLFGFVDLRLFVLVIAIRFF